MKKLGRTGKIIFYFVLLLTILLSIFLASIIVKAKTLSIETSENDFDSENQDIEFGSSDIQEEIADVTENTDDLEIVQSEETKETPKETAQETVTSSSKTTATTKNVAQNTEDKKATQSKTTTVTQKTSTAAATQCSKTSTPTTTASTQDTTKRLTQSEINAEKSKYLNDIKSIAPGLNYVYAKRGQVFWPYRTSEISVFTHNLTFGTIYYYVDTFVESGQEKFKYYIDWAS